MAHRTFFDRQGLRCEVWDVVPSLADRRVGAERREGERAFLDRRQSDGRWIGVRDEFAAGWLCFQNSIEKRRLAPIPAHWEQLSDDELLRLMQSAAPAVFQSRSV